jgi:predicted dithiol-disulfide oxidoreductase (DUF899 family)
MVEESWEAFTESHSAFNLLGIGEEYIAAWKQIYEEQGYQRAMLTVAQDGEGHFPNALIAYFYIFAGEREKAIQKLEEAFEERDPLLVYIKVAPEWDALREDPRFQEIVRRMNFPE